MQLPDADWPYICYTSHPWEEVVDWCRQTIGEFGEDIVALSINTDYKSTYLFRREQDAVLFKLRWS